MPATDRRMLTDAVKTSSSESILDFVIHCVYISEISRGNNLPFYRKVGWLFWASRPFETVLQSISGRLPERERKKEK